MGANENNLRELDASFPLGCLTCVTGVSGSGKSTLVDDILRRALFRQFYRSKDRPGKFDRLLGHPATIKAIKEGKSLAEIRKMWTADLDEFGKRREPHLLYE